MVEDVSFDKFELPDYILNILKYINNSGTVTQKELMDIGLPVRKIRYAIRRLKEEQIIISKPDLFDMRSLRYEINDEMNEIVNQVLVSSGI